MKTIVIIQARMAGARLPGKVLMPLGEWSILEWCIMRCQRAVFVEDVVVAVPRKDETSGITDLCRKLGVGYHVGSETNVLHRFVACAIENHADWIVRVCADCPFVLPGLISRLVEKAQRLELDYNGTGWQRRYPRGIDSEVLKLKALYHALADAKESRHFEHVSAFLYENPMLFTLDSPTPPPYFARPDLDLSVDEQDSLDMLRAVVEHIAPTSPTTLDVRQAINFIDSRPDLLAIAQKASAKVKAKYKAEGLGVEYPADKPKGE
ncbi:MAG: NTP transferase domain-containing protein [Pseudomonadota bacterium]